MKTNEKEEPTKSERRLGFAPGFFGPIRADFNDEMEIVDAKKSPKLFAIAYGIFVFLFSCFFQILACSAMAYLISLTFVGTWISDVVSAVLLRPVELYKIGALIGFVRSLKISLSLPSAEEIRRAWINR